MIDLTKEQPVTLAEAARLVPVVNALPGMAAKRPPHRRTLFNWSAHGKRGVILEAVPLHGSLVTTREALARFFAALTQARAQRFLEQQHATPGRHRRARSVRTRERSHAHAMQRLAQQHGL